MTSPGQGSTATYLWTTAARARVRSWGYLRPPVPVDSGTGGQNSAPGIDIPLDVVNIDPLDYYIGADGVPHNFPPMGAYLRTVGFIGTPQFSDIPPVPSEINLNADLRWLPTTASFTPDGTWVPSVGDGMVWDTEPPDLPYLDLGYSHAVRGGDEVGQPAIVLDGDAWLALEAGDAIAGAFTIVLVAVFRPNTEASGYSILESSTTDVTDPSVVDWALSYDGGILRFIAGATQATYPIGFPQGRPVMIALALDSEQAKLLIAQRSRASVVFSTSGMNLFDLQLYLGRNGGDLDRSRTAQMDVLDVAFYARSLSFDELADKLHLLDAVYGITG